MVIFLMNCLKISLITPLFIKSVRFSKRICVSLLKQNCCPIRNELVTVLLTCVVSVFFILELDSGLGLGYSI